MNQKTKIAVLAGINLGVNTVLALGVQAGSAMDQLKSQGIEPSSSRHSEVLQANTNEFEVSFLQVSASCKSSHSAFEPVSVAIENVPLEVRHIHAEIESA